MAKKTLVLSKLDVMSVAKIEAVLMFVVGIIYGVLASFFIPFKVEAITGSLGLAAGLGFASLIIMPILYAVVGFFSGAIGAFLYNIAADKIGGIKMEFKSK